MSCHTWIYEKVINAPSDEVMFRYFNKTTIEDGITKTGFWELKYLVAKDWYSETHYKNGATKSSQSVLDINKIPKEIKHLVTYGNDYYEIPNIDFHLIFDDTGLYKESEYHDIFRISHYPEVMLHSYKECEEFINSNYVVTELPPDYNESKDYYKYAVLEELSKDTVLNICRNFYINHPNTLITFG
jgi:hypothetical protein